MITAMRIARIAQSCTRAAAAAITALLLAACGGGHPGAATVLPSVTTADGAGAYTVSQYCDDNPSQANQSFASAYHAAYGGYPSYYSEAGYTKAQILVSALKSLHGDVSGGSALASAMKAVSISAPRGPVTISGTTHSPVQDTYICKVANVGGTLRNIPLLTYSAMPPWGYLSQPAWLSGFTSESTGRP
jgi:ABC-type branched-subunit amino acid transport system substrate-binding protein